MRRLGTVGSIYHPQLGTKERICPQCGKPFSVERPSRPDVFCSRECGYAARAGLPKPTYERICPGCGTTFCVTRRYSTKKFCTPSCYHQHNSRDGHKQWAGGRFVRSDGYVLINVSPGRAELEHRLIMEQHIGRKLGTDECVHHINGDRADNRLENLELKSRSQHTKDDHASKRDPSKWRRYKCDNCGTHFMRVASNATCKGQKHHYCSRSCFYAGRRGTHWGPDHGRRVKRSDADAAGGGTT